MALRGEWWIDDGGSAQFADGDVGDMNHEMYVIDMLSRSFLCLMDIDVDDAAGSLDNWDKEITKWLLEEEDVDPEIIENVGALDAAKEIVRPWSKMPKEQFEDAWGVACGGSRGIDPREYALKYDGWKRVKGNWVETWTMTKQDLKIIGNGLADTTDVEELEGELFNIEVRTTRTEYRDVPWSVIDAEDVSALREYGSKY